MPTDRGRSACNPLKPDDVRAKTPGVPRIHDIADGTFPAYSPLDLPVSGWMTFSGTTSGFRENRLA